MKKVSSTETTIFLYDASGKMVAEYSTQMSASPQVSYLTNDTLGSPRINTNENGAVTARHDYQPFGEDIATSQRTTNLGYNSDEIRKKFTGYEKDSETDLDFAQARYYAKNYGRFNSPDPLLTSATIYAPQTWNRYSYALNNPTKNTDPLGLFVWNESLGGDVTDDDLLRNAGNDRRAQRRAQGIIDHRNRIRNSMTAARNSANRRGLTEDQRNNITQSVDSYGTERDANGVTIGIGQLGRGVSAQTTVIGYNADEAGSKITAQITVIFDDDTSGNDLVVSIAHEGRHTADGQAYAAALTADIENGTNVATRSIANRTRFDREVRAYNVSSSVAQGLGLPTWSVDGNEIWSSGWSEQRRDTLRTQGIENLLRTSDNYRLTRNAPGSRYQTIGNQ